MSIITFDCNVTEIDIIPIKDNDENIFVLNEKSMIINMMNSSKEKILVQTEIEKKDAIKLAKLILFTYEQQ